MQNVPRPGSQGKSFPGASRMQSLLLPLLAACSSLPMVPAREWPWVREQADLVGTYRLWRACDYPLLASSATVRITPT
jgi:hypothetical protein